jgi:two-component system, cell cycle sensor histidine kinase and response regulator CckA
MLNQIFHDQDAEVLLNALLREVRDLGLITWNSEGSITSLSESCRLLMQLPGSVRVGGSVSELWQSPCREFLQAFDQHRDQLQDRYFVRELQLSRDGEIYWIELKVRRCPLSCGGTSAFLMIVREITDRRRVVENAQQTQDLFEAAIRNLQDAAIFVDPDRRIVTPSKGMEQVFGYAEQELIGKSARMLYSDEDDYLSLGELQTTPAGRRGHGQEIISFRRKSGEHFPAEAAGGPLRDRNGRLLGYIAVIRDFSQRLQLENDLREQTEMLESIFRQLPFALGVIDTQRQIMQMSDSALALFGYRQMELAGHSTRMLYVSDEAFEQAGESIYRTQPGKPVIADFQTRSGRSFKGRLQVSPLYDIDGLMKGFLMAIEDVTDQLQHDEQMRRYEEIVSASSDALVFVDANHVYQAANTVYLGLWQRQRHEVIGRHLSEIVGDEFYRRYSSPALARCFAGEVVDIDVTRVDYPGASLYVQARHNPYRNEMGEVVGVLITIRDVTQRHLAEMAMKEGEARFWQAAAFAEFAVWEMDVESRAPIDDAMLRHLLGYGKADGLENLAQWLEVVAEPDRQAITESFERILRQPKGVERLEYRARKKSGELVHIETLLEHGAQDGRRRLVGISRDITRLVEEREELRQYERMTSATEDGLALLDRNHVYLAVNTRYSKLHNLPRNQIVGRHVQTLLGETVYRDTVKPLLDTAFAGEDVSYENWIDYPQSSRRRMEFIYTPYQDAHGEITGLLVTSHDITERYQAEQALLESENKFHAIFENAPVGMMILDDRDAGILDINPAGLEIYGYSREEYLRLRPWDLVAGITQDNFVYHWQQLLDQQRAHFESVHYRKDGTPIYVLIDGVRMTLKAQPVVIASLVDITQHKALEANLREQEEQYRSLVESTSAILFSLNAANFSFNFVSPEAEILLGYPVAQWLASPEFWFDHVHPEDRDWVREYCFSSTRNRQDHSFEYRMIDADGRVVWLHDITRVVVVDEREVKLVGVMIDITARKAAEAERWTLSKIVEQSTEAIVLTDTNFGITYANEAFQSLYGYTLPELLGTKPERFNAENDSDLIQADIYNRVSTGQRMSIELMNRRKNGSVFTCAASISPLTDEQGRIIAYLGSQRDVSKRVQAEAALRASEERWQYALEGAGEGVWDWDVRSNRVYYSRRWKEMLGYREDEIGDSIDEWISRVHPDDLPDSRAALQRHIDGKSEHFIHEHRLRCKGGSYKWILDRGQIRERGEDGRPLRIIGTQQDVTQRKQAEAALKQSEEKYRQIVETAQEGIWVVDADGYTCFVNFSMAGMLGYDEAEMTGRHLFEFMDEESRRVAERKLAERSRGIPDIYEFRFRRRDGSDLWTTVSSNPLFDEHGRYNGSMAMINDISEAHKLQEALIRTQKMEAVGQLTGGIAHDFNNILGSVLGFAELAQDRFGRFDPKLSDYLQQIENAGVRARDLIRQLLIFSRGERVGTVDAILLAPLVKEFVKMLVPLLPAKVEIRTQLPEKSPSVKIDPVHVQQLLMNLCINARDALSGQGVISITLSMRALREEQCGICGDQVTGDWVSLRVDDTGRGIPAELLEDIFQPFVTSKGVGEGSGMGLAVVAGIVRSYGGHLLVESRPGQGASFEILLPMAMGAGSDETADSPADRMQLDLSGRRILVVDDERQILDYFKELLGDNGAEVTCCVNGMQALGRFVREGGAFDLVISDQSMPGMNGSELARQIRDLDSEVPLILYTGYGDAVSDETAQSLYISMLLQKPASGSELSEAIRLLLRERAEQ